MRSTNIPIETTHRAMCQYVEQNGHLDAKYINENSVSVMYKSLTNGRTQTYKDVSIMLKVKHLLHQQLFLMPMGLHEKLFHRVE